MASLISIMVATRTIHLDNGTEEKEEDEEAERGGGGAGKFSI